MRVEKKLQTKENIVILPRRRRQSEVTCFQGMECGQTVRHAGRNGGTDWERN